MCDNVTDGENYIAAETNAGSILFNLTVSFINTFKIAV